MPVIFVLAGFWNKRIIWVNGTPWNTIARGCQLQKGIILQLIGRYVAIRLCLERWRHFLVGIKFLILTDHVALTYIQSSATVSRRNARWLEFLS
jgi:RNase H-like domain found in reverse transcriptase